MSVDGINGEQSTPRKERKALMEFKPLALAAASMQWPLVLRAPADRFCAHVIAPQTVSRDLVRL